MLNVYTVCTKSIIFFCRVGVVIQDSVQIFRTHLADLQKMKGYTSDEKGCQAVSKCKVILVLF